MVANILFLKFITKIHGNAKILLGLNLPIYNFDTNLIEILMDNFNILILGGNSLNKLENQIVNEEKELTRLRKILESRKNYPDGRLMIKKIKGKAYYSLITKDKNKMSNIKYISQSNSSLAKDLAQKSYEKRVKKIVENNLKLLYKFNRSYSYDGVTNAFLNLSDERKHLVSPIYPTHEEKIANWKSEPYPKKKFLNDTFEILTNRNERVRSKSEKIIADLFDKKNLDYIYEKALFIEGVGYIYPDFTFLSPNGDTEIYWEHLGMIDSPEYMLKAVNKLELYHKNNIFIGERLLISFEGKNHMVDLNYVSQLVDRYLL